MCPISECWWFLSDNLPILCMTREAWAAWIQAIGSVGAIGATGALAIKQHAESTALQRNIRISELHEQFKAQKRRRIQIATAVTKLAHAVSRNALDHFPSSSAPKEAKEQKLKTFNSVELLRCQDKLMAIPITDLDTTILLAAWDSLTYQLGKTLDHMAIAKRLFAENETSWEGEFDKAKICYKNALQQINLFERAKKEIDEEQFTAPEL